MKKKRIFDHLFHLQEAIIFGTNFPGAAQLLSKGTTMGTTLANAWHNIWPEGIFGNGDFNDEEEFSGLEKTAIYELIERAKPENALSVKKRDIDDGLGIDENASTTNNLTDSEIAATVLNRTVDNASSRSEDQDEQPVEKQVSLEKCINLTGELISSVEKIDSLFLT